MIRGIVKETLEITPQNGNAFPRFNVEYFEHTSKYRLRGEGKKTVLKTLAVSNQGLTKDDKLLIKKLGFVYKRADKKWTLVFGVAGRNKQQIIALLIDYVNKYGVKDVDEIKKKVKDASAEAVPTPDVAQQRQKRRRSSTLEEEEAQERAQSKRSKWSFPPLRE